MLVLNPLNPILAISQKDNSRIRITYARLPDGKGKVRAKPFMKVNDTRRGARVPLWLIPHEYGPALPV